MAESLVRLPPSIQRKQMEDDIKQKIVSQVQKVQRFSSPLGLDIAHYIAVLIENFVTKAMNIAKMDLLPAIFQALYPSLSTADLQEIQQNVEYLLSLGVVKKISLLVRALYWSYELAANLLKKKVESVGL